MKKLILIFLVSIFLTACSSDPDGFPTATIELEDGSEIVIELNHEKAPNTVNNFIALAEDGFYDGLTFHRVDAGFVVQGGDPNGNGTGGPGYSIVGEMANNGFEQNDLKNNEGTIAMARSQSYDSAGSQFYFNVADNNPLDNEYAVFGKVIEGYDYVLEISRVATDSSDMPLEEIVIKQITIDKKGGSFDSPEVID